MAVLCAVQLIVTARMHDLTSLSEEVILERQVTSVLAVMSRLNQGIGQLKPKANAA